MRQSPKVLFFFLFKEHRIKKVMLMKRIYALVPCAVVFSMSFVPIMVNAVFAKTNITDTIHTEPDSSENYPADNTVLIDENTLQQEITSEKNNTENTDTEKISTDFSRTDFEDYITGVVAAEMPALFEPEALKAQAVAARTYAERRMANGNSLGTMIENGGQAYCSLDEMKEKWGNNFNEYYDKIKNAVYSTKGEIMVYNGEPILSVFHAISSGKTETAANIWSSDEPYLKSVDSSADTTAENYMSEIRISSDNVVAKLQAARPSLIISSGNLAAQTQIISRSESGYIQKIQIGNETFTGREIREILGLRSSDFSIKQDRNNIIFTTKGYGHGAGMSQYGANALALEGKNYHEILSHYYSGIEFKKE